ncbi:TonB-dependent receptor [Tsuneonella deserti]|uniref:TonB-dependent receptor n=2 Tax=Tsuneonella deserti TaxID=2035528 RepID=A0ABQ1RX01_9SPHN|nr:TonB-dependent receptor [Tsuneonella deserti]
MAQEADQVDDPNQAKQSTTGTVEASTNETDNGDDGEIVVSGFRASLESAQGIKRDADTVVDVITAEDIGALPDRSVAEALQRVPGVNVSRFEQRDDPDRFSVEGSGVIIRGLPFVRSELNGRDIFSANGGRELSFNDVSPELLGRIEVFKNVTADMIEGGISGTVNLVTRKPLDRRGLHIAGTAEANYGDLARKWSPGFSVLASNTFDTSIGTFGIQLAYAQSELRTRTDASQITDPCYRQPSLDGPCLRIQPVGSGGISGDFNFDPDNFPPAGSVIVPKGAGVRTTDLERDRKAYSGVLQWESLDGSAKVTAEYLRAETDARLNEHAILALVNDDGLFPIPADTWTFDDNGIFQTGTLTQAQPFNGGRGIPTEILRFQREDAAWTQDMSLRIELSPTDRLHFNAEVQYIDSDRTEQGLISAMQTYTDVKIDASGNTPIVQFLQPSTTDSPAGYFNDPSKTFYWFLIDNQVHNEGDLLTVRADGHYDLSDTGFLRSVSFGARWGDRNRVTRNANFSNWGNLGAPWTGRGGNWNCADFQAFGCGGAYVADFPNYAQVQNPFGNDFQRGAVPVPLGNGSAFFFGGDDQVAEYLSGLTQQQADEITAFTLTPNAWHQISDRGNVVPGLPWTPGEINQVRESTNAAYLKVDFGSEFGNGMELSGNIGLRYAETEYKTGGQIAYPDPTFFDKDNNGTVTQEEIAASCATVQPGQAAPGYCSLSPARQAEFAEVFTGEVVPDNSNITFHNWLPSFNAKLDVGNGLLFRVAASKAISRPDMNAFATGGQIFENTGNLLAGGTLATGPLFQVFTGNRLLRPIQSWNYDLSVEWYFDRVGSITVAGFYKDLKSLVNFGQQVRTFTSPSGVTTEVAVNGPVNVDEGKIKGVELAYQQTWDFLPGPLSGLGGQFTYTYVDSDLGNSTLGAQQSPFAGGLPLVGISKQTVNAVLFYEKYGFSARAAYNWRSKFLQTPRDVIFPFSPIYGEATGQLDASLFYDVTPHIKVGVQGVNLLDEVTRTSQVIDFDGTRVTRSAFRNDRRYTFLARFEF